MASLGFFTCTIKSFAEVLLPYQCEFLLFLFSCLIAVAQSSNTLLNKSGESGHPCLLPYLRGNAFSSSSLSTILPLGLSCVACIMLRYVPSKPPVLRVFIINACRIHSREKLVVWQEWRIVNHPLNELKMQSGRWWNMRLEKKVKVRDDWVWLLKKIILSTLFGMDWYRLIMRHLFRQKIKWVVIVIDLEMHGQIWEKDLGGKMYTMKLT